MAAVTTGGCPGVGTTCVLVTVGTITLKAKAALVAPRRGVHDRVDRIKMAVGTVAAVEGISCALGTVVPVTGTLVAQKRTSGRSHRRTLTHHHHVGTNSVTVGIVTVQTGYRRRRMRKVTIVTTRGRAVGKHRLGWIRKTRQVKVQNKVQTARRTARSGSAVGIEVGNGRIVTVQATQRDAGLTVAPRVKVAGGSGKRTDSAAVVEHVT